MGYSSHGIDRVFQLMGPDRQALRFLDCGSQDIAVRDEAKLLELRAIVAKYGGDGSKVSIPDDAFPSTVSAADMFMAIGIDYTCFDVDDRPGTIYVDYNTLCFDRSLYGKFDVVANAGTTEHLGNPNACFLLMHQCCRVGGLLFNNVPVCGYANHGLNNLTPKFWHTLRWMNSYEVVDAHVDYVPTTHERDGNFYGEHLAFISDLDPATRVSGLIELVLRKTQSRGFIPPYDAVLPTDDGGRAVAQLLAGSLRPFVAMGTLTAAEGDACINDFLIMQGLTYRVDSRLPSGGRSSPRSAIGAIASKLAPLLPQSVRQSPPAQWARRWIHS